jgi:hypothetical protein
VCAIIWAIWNARIKFLTEKFLTFEGYTGGYPLDPYVVLSTASGVLGVHGYWVQPFGDGRMGFIQPIRLAA